MVVRAVFILNLNCNKLLYYKKFETVEKLCEERLGKDFVALPNGEDLERSVIHLLDLDKITENDLAEKDSCLTEDQKPLFRLKTEEGYIWPLAIIVQFNLLYGCVGVCDNDGPEIFGDLNNGSISESLSLLASAAEFLGNPPNNVDQQPCWRNIGKKGVNNLDFILSENIKYVQYDKLNLRDDWIVYGSLSVQGDISDSFNPEVSITIINKNYSSENVIDSLTTHPNIKSVEDTNRERDGKFTKKLKFSLPSQPLLPICNYSCTYNVIEPPILAFYKARGKENVEFILQLKISQRMKNNFELLELRFPFFHRGSIKDSNINCSQGQYTIRSNVLLWNVGNKINNKQLEAFIKGNLNFAKYEYNINQEQFCIENNCYAQATYKINDYTASGLMVDKDSFNVTPPVKVKTSFNRGFSSVEHKIWNSKGDVPHCFTAPDELTQ
ncbi:DgyrCDS1367 [Dimorphilus gyrociliatus]|uniref:AP-5 complex subunit mu-1 n=1 Tax=Dimorphilus gyrociliatus TaxID=2664684 RepID=A0A7I8V771_9ANNE|nr:DgyrCDS1367 [Dimorphilus gyrociliatus]